MIAMRCNATMDIQEVRRRQMRKLIETTYGGVSRRLAIACKKPEGQINDMLSTPPRKPFGEKVARQIERILALPDLYFDAEEVLQSPVASGEQAGSALLYPADSLPLHPPEACEERRTYGLSPEEQHLVDGYRLADEGCRRSMLLLAQDALSRFGRRRANHNQPAMPCA